MRLHIVKIGCDLGVQLPQSVLKQYGIDEYVSMEIDGDSIIIRALPGEGAYPSSLEIHKSIAVS